MERRRWGSGTAGYRNATIKRAYLGEKQRTRSPKALGRVAEEIDVKHRAGRRQIKALHHRTQLVHGLYAQMIGVIVQAKYCHDGIFDKSTCPFSTPVGVYRPLPPPPHASIGN